MTAGGLFGLVRVDTTITDKSVVVEPITPGLQAKAGRRPLSFVEVRIPACRNTYGVAPCTAALPYAQACYNTLSTCQDLANYRGVMQVIGLIDEDDPRVASDYIPCVQSISQAATRIDPGRSLGQRANVQVTLNDWDDNDLKYFPLEGTTLSKRADPYIESRVSAAALNDLRGSFWGKFVARHPDYTTGTIRIGTSIAADDGSITTDIQEYVIERIDRKKGKVSITAKDWLSLVSRDRDSIPVATSATLTSDVASTLLFAVVRGDPSQFPASGVIRINDELIRYGAVSPTFDGAILVLTERAALGSSPDDHTAGDSVQLVYAYEEVNPITMVYDFLKLAQIPDSIINSAEIFDQRDTWYNTTATRVISKPTPLGDLLSELSVEYQFRLWYDDKLGQIRLRSIAPAFPGEIMPAIDDDSNIIENSFTTTDETEKRITHVVVYYDKRDFAGDDDDPANYKERLVYFNPGIFTDVRQKIIYALWIANPGDALALASTLSSKYSEIPKQIQFELDYKDNALWTGDTVDIKTSEIPDVDGSDRITRFEIIEAKVIEAGHRIRYVAQTVGGEELRTGTYAWFAPDDAPDYQFATPEQREAYWYFTDDNGNNPDGTTGDKFL